MLPHSSSPFSLTEPGTGAAVRLFAACAALRSWVRSCLGHVRGLQSPHGASLAQRLCFAAVRFPELAPLQSQLWGAHIGGWKASLSQTQVPVPYFCLLFTVGTQNRQQPPISLICSQRTAVSRKRNKKKKVPPKTVDPATVKQKPGVLETEKTAAASDQAAFQAAERTSAAENRVLGFGIVLESPSSDVS